MKHGIELACPRVETGLLAVKAAVEPKKVVMAAILMRDCQRFRYMHDTSQMIHARRSCLLKSTEPC